MGSVPDVEIFDFNINSGAYVINIFDEGGQLVASKYRKPETEAEMWKRVSQRNPYVATPELLGFADQNIPAGQIGKIKLK